MLLWRRHHTRCTLFCPLLREALEVRVGRIMKTRYLWVALAFIVVALVAWMTRWEYTGQWYRTSRLTGSSETLYRGEWMDSKRALDLQEKETHKLLLKSIIGGHESPVRE